MVCCSRPTPTSFLTEGSSASTTTGRCLFHRALTVPTSAASGSSTLHWTSLAWRKHRRSGGPPSSPDPSASTWPSTALKSSSHKRCHTEVSNQPTDQWVELFLARAVRWPAQCLHNHHNKKHAQVH